VEINLKESANTPSNTVEYKSIAVVTNLSLISGDDSFLLLDYMINGLGTRCSLIVTLFKYKGILIAYALADAVLIGIHTKSDTY
jgi:hypothetical protein